MTHDEAMALWLLDFPLPVWRCEACKDWRIDPLIAVAKGSVDRGRFSMGRNVCHCNDRPACAERAREIVAEFERQHGGEP